MKLKDGEVEVYVMGTLINDTIPVDKMLLVQRINMDISYHNSECQVLYFTDISDTK